MGDLPLDGAIIQPMAEPRVVVGSREHLWWLLAEASMLEHMIMCQYLFAEFSLKSSTGEGLTPEQLLTRFFTHTDETDEQLRALVDGAINLMAGAVRPLGSLLATMPVGPSHPGQTAGFAFDMYYPMGNFVPWRESAWALLRERTMVLADRCSVMETDGTARETIWQVQQRVETIVATLTLEGSAVSRT
jgi:hypothetical protein